MDLAITPPGRRLPRSTLTPPPERPWPMLRASAVLFRLAADQLDESCPSEAAKNRAGQLVSIGMRGPTLGAFLSTLESLCGMSPQVAGDAAQCLLHGDSMPWEPWSVQESLAGANGLEHVVALERAIEQLAHGVVRLRTLFGGDFARTADEPIDAVILSNDGGGCR